MSQSSSVIVGSSSSIRTRAGLFGKPSARRATPSGYDTQQHALAGSVIRSAPVPLLCLTSHSSRASAQPGASPMSPVCEDVADGQQAMSTDHPGRERPSAVDCDPEALADELEALDQATESVGGGVAVGHGDEQRVAGDAFGEAH